MVHFVITPLDISARECLLWGKCEGSVFLVSNDLSSVLMLPSSKHVCVSQWETGCAYNTSRELAQKETFEQQSSVGREHLTCCTENVDPSLRFVSELYFPFGGG